MALAIGSAAALSRSELPGEISPRWGKRNNLLSFACDFLLIGLPNAAVNSVLWRWMSLGRKLGPADLWQISLLPGGRSTRVVGYRQSFSADLADGGCNPEPPEILCIWAASSQSEQTKQLVAWLGVLIWKLG